MDKRYKSKSFKESMGRGSDYGGKEIMLTNMFRELNDSTSSSSSVVHGNFLVICSESILKYGHRQNQCLQLFA